MLTVHRFPCTLPRAMADSLNLESGRIYTRTLAWHYRIYRRQGLWLKQSQGERLEDLVGGATTLHAHSRDAAQQGFYKACKTARTNKGSGFAGARYPRKRKLFRTTIWKDTGLRLVEGESPGSGAGAGNGEGGRRLRAARAAGLEPVWVPLPDTLADLPQAAFRELRLVYDRVARRYEWHLVVEDGVPTPDVESRLPERYAAVDLGEIHPAVATDGESALVVSCRHRRAVERQTNQRLGKIRSRQSRRKKDSRRWVRTERRKRKFLRLQKRRRRDIEHKVSRAVVDWARDRKVDTLVIGDVRDIGDGKRLRAQEQQKISQWSHGATRSYITYKAHRAGIGTQLVPEYYTSQTCPGCQRRNKPRGRVYACPACGLTGPRDVVGGVNILSVRITGEVGQVPLPESRQIKYRRAVPLHRSEAAKVRSEELRRDTAGRRSALDTGPDHGVPSGAMVGVARGETQ